MTELYYTINTIVLGTYIQRAIQTTAQSSTALLTAVVQEAYGGVVFKLTFSFYPPTSVYPVSVLIPYPREILILWSRTEKTEKSKTKVTANEEVKQMKCQRTGYETATHARLKKYQG